MNKKKKNYIELRINKDKLLNKMLYGLGVLFLTSLIVNIFRWFLVPGALYLMNTLMLLWELYLTLEGAHMFYGTIFMLFISWKIFLAFIYLTEKCFEWTIQSLNKLEIEKLFKKDSHRATKNSEVKG